MLGRTNISKSSETSGDKVIQTTMAPASAKAFTIPNTKNITNLSSLYLYCYDTTGNEVLLIHEILADDSTTSATVWFDPDRREFKMTSSINIKTIECTANDIYIQLKDNYNFDTTKSYNVVLTGT